MASSFGLFKTQKFATLSVTTFWQNWNFQNKFPNFAFGFPCWTGSWRGLSSLLAGLLSSDDDCRWKLKSSFFIYVNLKVFFYKILGLKMAHHIFKKSTKGTFFLQNFWIIYELKMKSNVRWKTKLHFIIPVKIYFP